MSESAKPRFAIDLNEIERQLAQAGNPHPQPASAARSDPLAELARIVGQDDPFQSILANDGSARPRQQGASIDDLFAVRDTMTPNPREVPVRAPQALNAVPSYGHDAGIPRATFGIMSNMPRSPRAYLSHDRRCYPQRDYLRFRHRRRLGNVR